MANYPGLTYYPGTDIPFCGSINGISEDSNYRYDWLFDGGDTASGKYVKYAYSTSGIKVTTLTVTNITTQGFFTSTITDTIEEIIPPPK